MAKEITLPSGTILEIHPAPFEVADALKMIVAQELKGLKLDPKAEVDVNFYKDIFCVALSSKALRAAVWECMKRVTYGGLKISKDTFEPIEARQDYDAVFFEVAKENLEPFMKNLFAQFAGILPKIQTTPA